MVSKDLVPVQKPLPPQRGGILPTYAFWQHALETPVGQIVNAVGVALYVGLTLLLVPGLSFWQLLLLAVVFSQLWLGLFERWVRSRAGRRRALP